ncbi:MAG: hypothetical protein LBP83_06340 [Dysgonamonadaceae bacterium]|jgi:hypothetical protein|nr:hypothetical protein [Dysgonamonadaceae bacterium]
MKNILKYILIMIVAVGCNENMDYPPLDNPYSNDSSAGDSESTVAIYNDPAGFPGVSQSSIYEVTLIQGSQRIRIPVFQNACPVYEAGYMDMTPTDTNPLGMFQGRSISWSNFSFAGSITIEVKVIDTEKVPMDAFNVRVLPTRYGIMPSIKNGNLVTFTMTKPGQCSVEIGTNGYKNGLMIFANPIETNVPDPAHDDSYAVLDHATASSIAAVPEDKSGLYFKAGVHDIGVYAVPANIKNIYLEGSAWVYGAIHVSGTRSNTDVKIFGRGTLSSGHLKYREAYCIGTPQDGSTAANRITVEGITVADPKYFAIRLIGRNNLVSWTKVIGGWIYNCDGIAVFAGSTIKNCFCWANDDNIKVYRDNITVEDMVLWQLNNGGAIQMGWDGAQATGVTIKRVDLLHAEWNNSATNRGVLSFVGNRYANANSNCWQKNMTIEDLVTETPVRLIWRISPEQPISGVITPAFVDGLTMRNWTVLMNKALGSNNYINGVSDDYIMKNFLFDNVNLNGVKLTEENWITQGNFEIKNLELPTFK